MGTHIVRTLHATSLSCCGFKGRKLDLSGYAGNVVHCGAKHDRDENAARNILAAGGNTQTKNRQVGQGKTTATLAVACEMSIRRGAKARLFPSV